MIARRIDSRAERVRGLQPRCKCDFACGVELADGGAAGFDAVSDRRSLDESCETDSESVERSAARAGAVLVYGAVAARVHAGARTDFDRGNNGWARRAARQEAAGGFAIGRLSRSDRGQGAAEWIFLDAGVGWGHRKMAGGAGVRTRRVNPAAGGWRICVYVGEEISAVDLGEGEHDRADRFCGRGVGSLCWSRSDVVGRDGEMDRGGAGGVERATLCLDRDIGNRLAADERR